MAEKYHIAKLPKDQDLLQCLNELCAELNFTRGSVQLIGALQKANLGFYHQDTRQYTTKEFDEGFEIISGLGNISLKDGKPFVHLHLSLCRSDFSNVCGHTMPGCTIFACEVILRQYDGPELVRGLDEATGLPLWRTE